MGMNYYARVNACSSCGHCHDRDTHHIGKSSAGWKFTLHVDDPKGHSEHKLYTFLDWERFLSQDFVRIFNEDEEELTTTDILDLINRKGWNPDSYKLDQGRYDPEHCVGTSDTYTLMIGYFS
jgi:hypothetical protein